MQVLLFSVEGFDNADSSDVLIVSGGYLRVDLTNLAEFGQDLLLEPGCDHN